MGELANDDLLGQKQKKCSFLALVGMLAQTLKNTIKKLGLRLGFLKIYFQKVTKFQHAKKSPRRWEWACLGAKNNTKPWVKTPIDRPLPAPRELALCGGKMHAFVTVIYT